MRSESTIRSDNVHMTGEVVGRCDSDKRDSLTIYTIYTVTVSEIFPTLIRYILRD